MQGPYYPPPQGYRQPPPNYGPRPMHGPMNPGMPVGVIILGILTLLLGGLLLLVGIGSLVLLGIPGMELIGLFGLFYLILGISGLASAIGMFMRKPWAIMRAKSFYMSIVSIVIFSTIITYVITKFLLVSIADIVIIVLAIIAYIYLGQPNVRAAFGMGGHRTRPPQYHQQPYGYQQPQQQYGYRPPPPQNYPPRQGYPPQGGYPPR
ncbi:MAG: hypothetical protein QCI38_02475 [Candidatus Thermoplasmatota archaeon]|nr:hypothetical protein [Candidatus Thermoplasmatota archaeon]